MGYIKLTQRVVKEIIAQMEKKKKGPKILPGEIREKCAVQANTSGVCYVQGVGGLEEGCVSLGFQTGLEQS